MDSSTGSGSATDQQQKLLFAIIEYLAALKQEGKFDAEGLGVAIEVLQAASGLSLTNDEHKKQYSAAPLTLPQIFNQGLSQTAQASSQMNDGSDEIQDPELREKFNKYLDLLKRRSYLDGCDVGSHEYNDRVSKARVRFLAKFKADQQAAASTPAPASPAPAAMKYAGLTDAEKLTTAETLKNEGNKKLTARQYDEAITFYSDAISLNPNNAIYYSNRAAAYTHLAKHDKAIEDCKKAISLDANYAKAYSRLGLAYFSTAKYKLAVDAYTKAVELEPSNTVAQESLQAAQARLDEENTPKSAPEPAPAGGPAGGAPAFDPSLLANLFGGGGAGGAGAGGMPNMGGLGALLNNPQFMNMAQGLMQNPQFMNMAQSMMQNPDALKNLGKMFGKPPGEDDDDAPAV